jgi:hypothetical protein
MTDRLGDGPVEAEYAEQMRALARLIDDFFNGPPTPDRVKSVGFILMVFPFGDEGRGRCNYMSNALREDVVIMMKEQIARFEGQAEVRGTA